MKMSYAIYFREFPLSGDIESNNNLPDDIKVKEYIKNTVKKYGAMSDDKIDAFIVDMKECKGQSSVSTSKILTLDEKIIYIVGESKRNVQRKNGV